jgi:hypothetical protein
MLDGVCNPVRNVLELKRYGRGCKPRPAHIFIFKNQLFILDPSLRRDRLNGIELTSTANDRESFLSYLLFSSLMAFKLQSAPRLNKPSTV